MKIHAITLVLGWCAAGSLCAGDLPILKLPLSDVQATQGNTLPAIDLRNHFELTGITGQVVQLRTVAGTFNLDTFAPVAPVTVSNFLNYVNSGRYATSIVHRSDQSLGVIQGGGYVLPTFDTMVTDPPIPLEYRLPNARGTIAMARAAATNSATSQWFINTKDNSTTLGQANGGGYAVFGRVTGTGMAVVDAIGALPVYAFSSPYGQMPLRNYVTNTQVLPEHAIAITAAEAIPVFPTAAGQNSVVKFTVANSNPTIAQATVTGSRLDLLLNAEKSGHTDITVTATDSNGNPAQDTFHLRLAAPDGSAGWFNHHVFGYMWDAGGNWYGGSAYGWMWEDPASDWIWSTSLQGWLAVTDPNSRAVWSTQFRWLTPSASDPYQADTTSIGPIYVGKYSGVTIPESWVVSDRFGYVWANGDGTWFWSQRLNTWLGVTPDRGIWSVAEGKFL